MTIGVADIRADLGGMVFGVGQELGTLRRPLRVRRGDVRDPDVEERAGMAGVGWRRERHGGLIIGRAAADVEDQPAVRIFKMTGSRSSTTVAPNTDR